MPLFYLLRHGETEYVKQHRLAGRFPGVHLNDTGRAQAQTLAERLKNVPFKAIYSSPMERAIETAEPLGKVKALPVEIHPGLYETEIGEWMDKSVKQLARTKPWKMVSAAPSRFRFPGGERFADTQYRIAQELEELVLAHAEKDIVACVSHADPIKLAVAYFIGLPLDLFQRLTIDPTSITVLHITPTSSQLVGLNINPSATLPQS